MPITTSHLTEGLRVEGRWGGHLLRAGDIPIKTTTIAIGRCHLHEATQMLMTGKEGLARAPARPLGAATLTILPTSSGRLDQQSRTIEESGEEARLRWQGEGPPSRSSSSNSSSSNGHLETADGGPLLSPTALRRPLHLLRTTSSSIQRIIEAEEQAVLVL